LPKGENPDIDFKRAKELIDEKAIADALLHFIKEKVLKGTFWSVYQMDSLFINVIRNMILIICHKRIH
jgi:DNA topoisomerase-1